MHEGICEALLANGVQLLYVTNRTVEQTARKIAAGHSSFHCEVSINEKIAFELALAGSLASKRTACLLSSEGLYEAIDSLIASAYTDVACGFLVIAVQENDEEVTPVGLFSKLPLLVTESADEFQRAVEYGYYISGKYKIPVVVQTASFEDSVQRTADSYQRTVNGWATTPKPRYQPHQELHDKIEKIRDEFEDYEGNRKIIKDTTGIITDRLSHLEFYDEDASVLKISTVHPLPDKLVMDFIGDMKEVFMAETYPAIEFQIPQGLKVKKGLSGMMHRGPKPEETIYGFHIVRDKLGHASSINLAHGIKKCMPEKKVLAVTYEDHFFHSGIPAFVNALCNDAAYVLLVMSRDREEEIKNILHGFGFHNCFHLKAISEIERFQDAKELTVLFCRGIG